MQGSTGRDGSIPSDASASGPNYGVTNGVPRCPNNRW